MEISLRDLFTVFHGMGFGALFMLAFAGAVAELYRMSAPATMIPPSSRAQLLLRWYLVAMVILAWATVLSGTYIVYSWYRAVPHRCRDLVAGRMVDTRSPLGDRDRRNGEGKSDLFPAARRRRLADLSAIHGLAAGQVIKTA